MASGRILLADHEADEGADQNDGGLARDKGQIGGHPTGYGRRDRWAMRPEAGLPDMD